MEIYPIVEKKEPEKPALLEKKETDKISERELLEMINKKLDILLEGDLVNEL